jgi:hypothetical protein
MCRRSSSPFCCSRRWNCGSLLPDSQVTLAEIGEQRKLVDERPTAFPAQRRQRSAKLRGPNSYMLTCCRARP